MCSPLRVTHTEQNEDPEVIQARDRLLKKYGARRLKRLIKKYNQQKRDREMRKKEAWLREQFRWWCFFQQSRTTYRKRRIIRTTMAVTATIAAANTEAMVRLFRGRDSSSCSFFSPGSGAKNGSPSGSPWFSCSHVFFHCSLTYSNHSSFVLN